MLSTHHVTCSFSLLSEVGVPLAIVTTLGNASLTHIHGSKEHRSPEHVSQVLGEDLLPDGLKERCREGHGCSSATARDGHCAPGRAWSGGRVQRGERTHHVSIRRFNAAGLD